MDTERFESRGGYDFRSVLAILLVSDELGKLHRGEVTVKSHHFLHRGEERLPHFPES